MNYEYVTTTFEFIPDSGYIKNDVVYNTGYLRGLNGTELLELGLYKTKAMPTPINADMPLGTYSFNLVDGIAEYTPNYTILSAEAITAKTIGYFTDYTTNYIEGKVADYNKANGLAFKDIDAFTKYAVTASSAHNAIANQFITYASNIWAKARIYQAERLTLGVTPTEVEFKAILDSVVF